MARHAIELLTDRAKAAEMGRKGRERALGHFSRDEIVDQYESLYCELVECEDRAVPRAL